MMSSMLVGLLTGGRADGLPVEVVVPDLASVVELRRGAAIVVGLHNDLHEEATMALEI